MTATAARTHDEIIAARVAACDDHGIRVDGKFAVVCRDKIGNFHAGCVEPRIPSDRPFTLAEAVTVAKRMARTGYCLVSMPPGLLVRGEMTITRLPN